MARSLNLKLKSLRVMKDLTQEEFSKILGMHEVTYNRKEKGINSFSLEEARLISKYFEQSIEEIFFT